MEIKIVENLYLDVDPKEEFSIISSYEELFYDKNDKVDEFLFKTQNYNWKDETFGQKYFNLKLSSLQEYYEVLGYLCSCGYDKRLKTIDEAYKLWYRKEAIQKQTWSLEKIKKMPEEFKKYLNTGLFYRQVFNIDVLVDYKKLWHWRETLKNIPGYKYKWLMVDRQPNLMSDYIIK
jgi:hypothetical protein